LLAEADETRIFAETGTEGLKKIDIPADLRAQLSVET